jgi:CheY-like chemotaxis protein
MGQSPALFHFGDDPRERAWLIWVNAQWRCVRSPEQGKVRVSRTKILLVEDEPLVLRNTADLLTEDGYDVTECTGCEEALARLEAEPDTAVLVTDLNVACPGDGMTLARVAAERWPHLRIVMVSGALRPPQGTYPERAIFFTKPYAPGALLHVVRSPDFA